MDSHYGADRRSIAAATRSALAAGVVAVATLHLTADLRHVAAAAVAAGIAVLAVSLERLRRAERAARLSAAEEDARMRALLHSTLESTADGILTVDLEGRIVSHNQRFLELWGLESSDLVGEREGALRVAVEQIVDVEGFLRRVRELRANPDLVAEDLLEFRDGRVLHRTTQPHRLQGRTVGRVWSFRDITGQRRTELALAASERRFRRMVRNVPGVIFQFYVRRDNTLWFTYLSDGCQSLLGVTPSIFPWRADTLVQRVHPDDMAALAAIVGRCTSSLEGWTWEGRITLQGVTRWLRAASRPTPHDDGKITWDGLLVDVTEEKLAAEALQRREEQLAEAQALAHIGSWEWDLLSGRVVVSDEHWRIFGLEPGAVDWSHAHYMEAVHPEDRDRVQRGLERSLRNGTESALDYRIVRPDGEVRVVTSRGKVVRDEAGRPQRMLGTVQDVTEQKAAAQALERRVRAQQALTRAARLLSGSAECDLVELLELIARAIDADRGYLFRSRPENGAVLMDATDEWHDDGVPGILADLQGIDTATTGWWIEQLTDRSCVIVDRLSDLPETAAVERQLLERHGVTATVAVPLIDDARGLVGFIGFDHVSEDGTWSREDVRVLQTTAEMLVAHFSRRRAEQALRESEERFRQMAESMREVFFMVSADGQELIYLSPSYEEVWGRDRGDAASFMASILPEDRHVVYADMALSMSGEGDPLRYIEYRIARPDGSIRWIRHRTFQIRDEHGRPFRVTGVCSDITEQKQLEEELRRANRIEAIGHLAAGIAHEINTPIQYIGDNVRFLDESYAALKAVVDAYQELHGAVLSGGVTPPLLERLTERLRRADVEYVLSEAPRASAQALEGVQRVAEIVRAMKEFSHPGTGEKIPADLNQAILSTTTVARNEWKYLAELVTDLDPMLPPVTCLPGEINQAILNLVVNAAHAIGERRVAEGSDARGTITISTRRAGDAIEIRVSDTGTGIPEEIRGRVFDPFFTTKEVGRGTGQGLTFVHAIVVEKHGGTVGFETEVGTGTTFILRLPQHAAQPMPPAALTEAA